MQWFERREEEYIERRKQKRFKLDREGSSRRIRSENLEEVQGDIIVQLV